MTTLDWLATPTQALAEVTTGAVHHDGLDQLHPVRRALSWYPDDVWRYVLACPWRRISQEEPFAGRCGEVGDELGSAVVAARLVRDLMRLCLLMSRTYPPYSKWLGSAFAAFPAPTGSTRSWSLVPWPSVHSGWLIGGAVKPCAAHRCPPPAWAPAVARRPAVSGSVSFLEASA